MQAQRALEYLRPDNPIFLSRAHWALGSGYQQKGDRTTARQAFTEAIRQAAGNPYYTTLASASLAQVEECENRLRQAAAILKGEAGIGVKRKDISFDDAAKVFLEWAKANKRPRTFTSYESHIRQLKKHFSGKNLSKISPFDLEKYKLARIKEGAAVHGMYVTREPVKTGVLPQNGLGAIGEMIVAV